MTTNTKAFTKSVQQNVMVITPQGDSLGYRDVDVHREAVEIVEELKQKGVQRLVIDLSHGNYFSSLMIGVINSFGQTVRQSGGEMFLGGASDEMLAILKIMKFDELWPHFPAVADAVKVAKGFTPSSKT